MVGMGVLMIVTAWFTFYTLRRKNMLSLWHLRGLTAMTFSGWVATLAGWYVTEMGRQPYLIAGILRTKDAVTKVPPEHVGMT